MKTCLIVLFLIVLSSCGQPRKPADFSLLEPGAEVSGAIPTSTGRFNVALVMKSRTNPFYIEMERGARRAEKELGINLIVRTAAQESSIEQMNTTINELVNQDVDAIVITPAFSALFSNLLKRAQEAGIVIINIDNRLDPDYAKQIGLAPVPYITVDNYQGAYLSAQYIAERITEPGVVLLLEGLTGSVNAEDRKQGALRAFSENPNIQLVLTQSAEWKIDEARRLTNRTLADYPNLRGIFCANDMMALGAIEALRENERTDVLVAGYDALDEAKQAIREGTLAITIDQHAGQQGYLGVLYAVQALQGQSIPPETIIEITPVTRESLNETEPR